MNNVHQLNPEITGRAWPVISNHLDRLFNNDPDMAPKVVFERILSGDWKLWTVWDENKTAIQAVIAVSINHTGTGNPFARVELMEGKKRTEWLPLLTDIENWAVDQGCDRMVAEVPKKFAPDMPDWRMRGVVMERFIA